MRTDKREGDEKVERALTVYEATVGLLERRAKRNTEQLPVTAQVVACADPDAAFGP
jgi:hypothetical protein